jgi:hypothetical protein
MHKFVFACRMQLLHETFLISTMTDTVEENNKSACTVVQLPLTEDDITQLEKAIAGQYAINLLLIPLLLIIFFWGLVYFGIFLGFVVLCNIMIMRASSNKEADFNRPKIVFTGTITNKIERSVGERDYTIIFLGTEEFDIAHAKLQQQPAIGDIVSLHYTQDAAGERRTLIAVHLQGSEAR